MRYEAEMKAGIINFLKDGHNCKNIIYEVNSGYGIADFVGMANLNSTRKGFFYFKNKIDVFFLQKMRINQPVHIEEIEKNVQKAQDRTHIDR
jgi:hypothetical protein